MCLISFCSSPGLPRGPSDLRCPREHQQCSAQQTPHCSCHHPDFGKHGFWLPDLVCVPRLVLDKLSPSAATGPQVAVLCVRSLLAPRRTRANPWLRSGKGKEGPSPAKRSLCLRALLSVSLFSSPAVLESHCFHCTKVPWPAWSLKQNMRAPLN